MIEEMKNEIEKYAGNLGITVDEAEAVFNGIATENNLDVTTDNGLKIARSLFRSKFSQQMNRNKKAENSNGDSVSSFVKTANGMFYSVGAARDWQEYRINQIRTAYERDANDTLTSGKVAVATLNEDNKYDVVMCIDDEMKEKTLVKLPEGKAVVEVDEDKWILPLDDRKIWNSGDANKGYGKPIDAESWSRNMLFLGSVDGGENRLWSLTTKGEVAKNFAPSTFEWCEFTCIPASNRDGVLYAKKDGSTESSLNYVESNENVQQLLTTHLQDKVSPLSSLESYHNNSEKYSIAITDGIVNNMNLNRGANGNAALFIGDKDADFDYDANTDVNTALWIPEHISINFGVGSEVIVVGRTSQREVDGEMQDVSINVTGLHVVHRHGSADEAQAELSEDNYEWF